MKKINLKAKITKNGNTYYVPYHPVNSMYDLFYNKLGLRTSTNGTNLSYYLYNTDTEPNFNNVISFLGEERKSGTGFSSDSIKRYISFLPNSDIFEYPDGQEYKKYKFTFNNPLDLVPYAPADYVEGADKYIIKNDLNNYRYKTIEFNNNKIYAKTYEINLPDVGYTINGTNGDVRRDDVVDTVEIDYTPWDLASEHPNTVFTSSDGPAVHCYVSCVLPDKTVIVGSDTSVFVIEQGYYIGFDVLAGTTYPSSCDYHLYTSDTGSSKTYHFSEETYNYTVHVIMRVLDINPTTGQVNSEKKVEIKNSGSDWNYDIDQWYHFFDDYHMTVGPTSATGTALANIIKDIDFGELDLNRDPSDPYPKPGNYYISYFKIYAIVDQIYCKATLYNESFRYNKYFTMPTSVLWGDTTTKTITLTSTYTDKTAEMEAASISANLPYVIYNIQPSYIDCIGKGYFYGKINGICGNFVYVHQDDEYYKCFNMASFAITGFIDLNYGASEIIGTSGTVSIQLVEVIEEVQE